MHIHSQTKCKRHTMSYCWLLLVSMLCSMEDDVISIQWSFRASAYLHQNTLNSKTNASLKILRNELQPIDFEKVIIYFKMPWSTIKIIMCLGKICDRFGYRQNISSNERENLNLSAKPVKMWLCIQLWGSQVTKCCIYNQFT